MTDRIQLIVSTAVIALFVGCAPPAQVNPSPLPPPGELVADTVTDQVVRIAVEADGVRIFEPGVPKPPVVVIKWEKHVPACADLQDNQSVIIALERWRQQTSAEAVVVEVKDGEAPAHAVWLVVRTLFRSETLKVTLAMSGARVDARAVRMCAEEAPCDGPCASRVYAVHPDKVVVQTVSSGSCVGCAMPLGSGCKSEVVAEETLPAEAQWWASRPAAGKPGEVALVVMDPDLRWGAAWPVLAKLQAEGASIVLSAFIKDSPPACREKAEAAPLPASPRLLLVRGDAAFHTRPDDGAKTVRAARRAQWWQPVVAELVEENDGWVHVRSRGGRVVGCGDTYRNALGPLDLDLYVRSADVLPVLASEYEHTFDDGSAVTLRSGVVLNPTGRDGEYDLSVGAGLLRLVLPANVVAKTYGDSKTWPIVSRDHFLRPGAEIRWAGKPTLAMGKAVRPLPRKASAPALALRKSPNGFRVLSPKESDGLTQIEFGMTCYRFVAYAPPRAMKRAWSHQELIAYYDRQGERVGGIVSMAEPGADLLRIGTKLVWPDGTTAGSVQGWTHLIEDAKERGALRCFRHEVFSGGGELEVCVE